MWQIDPIQFLLAILLDWLLGDPQDWPHLARITGSLTNYLEPRVTGVCGRTIFSGFMLWCAVCGGMLGGYALLNEMCVERSPVFSYGLGIFMVYQTIAVRDLDRHVLAILRPMTSGNLDGARQKLSMIVGRDTKTLDEGEINRAAIESVAESLTDGILAPLFWAAIAGPAGALIYRVSNTLDSMVGHRNARYENVGKVSARIDDALSWIPARLTALTFVICKPTTLSWNVIKREARTHASPNAGWGESAMAHALAIRLGGDNWYQGERVSGAVFNPSGRTPRVTDLQDSLNWMWKITELFSVLCLLTLYLRRYFYAI